MVQKVLNYEIRKSCRQVGAHLQVAFLLFFLRQEVKRKGRHGSRADSNGLRLHLSSTKKLRKDLGNCTLMNYSLVGSKAEEGLW